MRLFILFFQNTFEIEAYFPNATWYDFYSGSEIKKVNSFSILSAPLSKINVHLRGGYIIPLQVPEMTTTQRFVSFK
jgi:alpha-glucosidase (family GH31 glycosyl hydrolase)